MAQLVLPKHFPDLSPFEFQPKTHTQIYSLEDASYIDGYINATFDGNSTMISANATAKDMRLGLESIGTGSLSVTRSGVWVL